MHVLSLSVLLSLSSTGFAEIIMNSSGGSGQATVNWSSSDASQLLNGDSLDDDGEDISPKFSNDYQSNYFRLGYGNYGKFLADANVSGKVQEKGQG